jgi:hypothetical protein
MTRVRTIAGVLELLRRWFNDNRRTRAFWRFSHRPERCACAAPVGARAAVPVEGAGLSDGMDSHRFGPG